MNLRSKQINVNKKWWNKEPAKSKKRYWCTWLGVFV